MANATLLPEEDPLNQPQRHHATPLIVCSDDRLRELASLPVRFNPQVGKLGSVGQRIFETARFDLSPHPEPTTCKKPEEGQR